jgi:6-phosphogluconolactonase
MKGNMKKSGRRHPSPMGILATTLACLALAAFGFAAEPTTAAAATGKVAVYVGTYTDSGSKGIYRLKLDLASGTLAPDGDPASSDNPSFLALHPSGRFLYAVNEVDEFGGKKTGAVSAFAVDATGGLKLLNQQPSEGTGPCHISLDKDGRHALVANYGGGSVAVLPIDKDGRLGPASSSVQHKGSSVSQHQEGPHAHSIDLDAANRFAFVADLGLDKVLVYRFDAAKGTLAPNEPPAAGLKPGAGPRHFTFHPSGRFAYVINELQSTVTAFSYDAASGRLEELQTVSTRPEDFKGENDTAEILVSRDGRFLYGSNRGHDSIAIFAIDAATGKLTPVGHQSTLGKAPRHFGIDPTGAYLLAANQNSDTITVFRIDSKGGRLEPVGRPYSVPKPVCVTMVVPAK